MSEEHTPRRRFLKWAGGLAGAAAVGSSARAMHTPTHLDDTVAHKLVYQCNKADAEYLSAVMFSVGEMLRKYGDDIWLVVTAIGPGLHILGKHPERSIAQETLERVESLAAYGVHFHACGNTMKALGWTKDDLRDFAEVVPIGVDDLMQLQERGFAYVSW